MDDLYGRYTRWLALAAALLLFLIIAVVLEYVLLDVFRWPVFVGIVILGTSARTTIGFLARVLYRRRETYWS